MGIAVLVHRGVADPRRVYVRDLVAYMDNFDKVQELFGPGSGDGFPVTDQ